MQLETVNKRSTDQQWSKEEKNKRERNGLQNTT
jgi:hypothetical protein